LLRAIDFKAEAHRDPWSIPLDEIDVSNPYLYCEDTWNGFVARLRRDDPVHPQPRHHLSFGFGIHRCVGNRLAEMQRTILWEEILKRFPPIEVVSTSRNAPTRISFAASLR
jgi:hypothetical protein